MVDRTFLQSHALFGGLSDSDADSVLAMLKEARFRSGEWIVLEGDCDNRVFLIVSGSVKVLKKVSGPCGCEEEELAVLGEGMTFGEMEVIDIQPRSASVRAVADTVVLTLSSTEMYKIYKSMREAHTLIIMNIAREISRRLRKMDVLAANTLYAREHEHDRSVGGTASA